MSNPKQKCWLRLWFVKQRTGRIMFILKNSQNRLTAAQGNCVISSGTFSSDMKATFSHHAVALGWRVSCVASPTGVQESIAGGSSCSNSRPRRIDEQSEENKRQWIRRAFSSSDHHSSAWLTLSNELLVT